MTKVSDPRRAQGAGIEVTLQSVSPQRGRMTGQCWWEERRFLRFVILHVAIWSSCFPGISNIVGLKAKGWCGIVKTESPRDPEGQGADSKEQVGVLAARTPGKLGCVLSLWLKGKFEQAWLQWPQGLLGKGTLWVLYPEPYIIGLNTQIDPCFISDSEPCRGPPKLMLQVFFLDSLRAEL